MASDSGMIAPGGKPSRTRWWLLALKITVTVVLCAIIAQWIDWSTFWTSLRNIDPALALFAFLALISGFPLSAFKWSVVLGAHGARISLLDLNRYYFIAFFLGQFLPTSIGGDAYRAYMTAKPAGGWSTAITAILIERLSGIAGLALLGYIGSWAVWLQTGNVVAATTIIVCTTGGLIGLPVLLLGLRMRLPAWIEKIGPLAKILRLFRGSLAEWSGQTGRMIAVALLSILFHVIKVLMLWLILRALGAPADPYVLAMAALVVEIAAMIPISIGGIGVVEGSFVAVMALFGLPQEASLATVLILRGLAITVSLLGALFFLADGKSRHAVKEAEDSEALEVAAAGGTPSRN